MLRDKIPSYIRGRSARLRVRLLRRPCARRRRLRLEESAVQRGGDEKERYAAFDMIHGRERSTVLMMHRETKVRYFRLWVTRYEVDYLRNSRRPQDDAAKVCDHYWLFERSSWSGLPCIVSTMLRATQQTGISREPLASALAGLRAGSMVGACMPHSVSRAQTRQRQEYRKQMNVKRRDLIKLFYARGRETMRS